MSGLSILTRDITGLFFRALISRFKILELCILYHRPSCLSIEKFKKIELFFDDLLIFSTLHDIMQADTRLLADGGCFFAVLQLPKGVILTWGQKEWAFPTDFVR